jgi:hypothetical protein
MVETRLSFSGCRGAQGWKLNRTWCVVLGCTSLGLFMLHTGDNKKPPDGWPGSGEWQQWCCWWGTCTWWVAGASTTHAALGGLQHGCSATLQADGSDQWEGETGNVST